MMRRVPANNRALIAGVAVLALLSVQVLALRAMGHRWICECGYVALWYANPAGPETSQHIADWYSFTHLVHGFGFYVLLWLVAPRSGFAVRLVLIVALEAVWEIVENTPVIIDRYRQLATARGYFGDSAINSLSDTLAAVAGAVLARTIPTWASIVFVIAIEAFLAYAIRDNLTLNVIQLISPNEIISRWQTGN
jgi:hypothetical protein